MRMVSRLLTFVTMSCIFFTLSYAQELPKINLAKEIIVAERTNTHGVRAILSVNSDDIIHQIEVGLPNTKGPIITANLGMRIARSGELDLAPALPKGQIATYARRVSLEDGSRIHIVLGWGFSSLIENLTAYCNLYVFRERNGKADLVLKEEEIGTSLEQIAVEDINRDGKMEIFVTAREGHEDSTWIFQIEPVGTVKLIQQIDGDFIHTVADRFADGEGEIFVQNRTSESTCSALCYDVTTYVWSVREKKFVKRR